MISRRKFMRYSALVLFLSAPSYRVLGQLLVKPFYIPYTSGWKLPEPFAGCSEIKKLVAEAKGIRNSIKTDDGIVDLFIAENLKRKQTLDAEVKLIAATIDEMSREQLVAKLGLLTSVSFLIAGGFATTPLAIGALTGIQIFGGSALLGFQAIYTKANSPALVAAYTKDRVFIFGEAVSEHAGSSGGKLLTKTLSIASLAADTFSFHSNEIELGTLQNNLKLVSLESTAIAETLAKYPATDRGPWKAMYDRILEGTIRQLEALLAEHASTDCRLNVTTGPVLKTP